MSAAIEVRDLSRHFGDFVAVDAVSFEVPDGEIFGFLGPNGAGKTTTIKMLTGLLRPTGGTALVDGLDTAVESRGLRSRIGYMSQKFSLYADLTVAENIALFAGLYGVSGERLRARREWVIRMAGLAGQEHRTTGDLPLGWKQRLALGCSVLHEPRILFLDEPTSGVDPVARRAFWELIDDLAAAGTTILVSTHYMEEAEYCNRLVLMNRGRLIAEGTPSRLRDMMAEPIYSLKTPRAPAAVEVLGAAAGIVEAGMYGRDVHVVLEPSSDPRRSIDQPLAAAGIPFGEVTRTQPTLEDVFVSLVRREGGAVAG